MSEKNKKEWKSKSFSLLMKQKEYALEVYNYLNGSKYHDEEEVIIEELDGGITLSVRNDTMFFIDGYINLYEHQSSINPNMPVRFLFYISQYYKQKLKGYNLYGSKLLKLPTPKLIVFYNGLAPLQEKEIYKLSDAFERPVDNPPVEVICEVYNINPGYNRDMQKKCTSIAGYIRYTEKVREYLRTMETDSALTKAIDECISEGILPKFFKEHKNMIISADAIDCTIETRERFAYEEGVLNSIKSLMQSMDMSVDAAMNALCIQEKDKAKFKSMIN